MTIASIARLQLSLHQGSTGVFDYFEPGSGDDKVCWAAKVINGVTLILLRGSVKLWDWLRDLDAFAPPLSHATLGPVHPGFFLGVPQAWVDIQAHTKAPYVVSGHSLGAARSAYISAFMTLAGIPPLARVAFGEPKPGFRPLANILAKVPQNSYRNGDAHYHDLITNYPMLPPPEDYVHPSPLIEVSAVPNLAETLEFGAFDWHKMELYSEATSGIQTSVTG